MLELVNVRKTRTRAEILRGVSLEITSGEVVSIVGPNGAGKSTLIDIAAGVLLPDSGKVLVNGRDIHADFRAKSLLTTVFQETMFDAMMTPKDALMFHAKMLGIRNARTKIEEIIVSFGRFPSRVLYDLRSLPGVLSATVKKSSRSLSRKSISTGCHYWSQGCHGQRLQPSRRNQPRCIEYRIRPGQRKKLVPPSQIGQMRFPGLYTLPRVGHAGSALSRQAHVVSGAVNAGWCPYDSRRTEDRSSADTIALPGSSHGGGYLHGERCT